MSPIEQLKETSVDHEESFGGRASGAFSDLERGNKNRSNRVSCCHVLTQFLLDYIQALYEGVQNALTPLPLIKKFNIENKEVYLLEKPKLETTAVFFSKIERPLIKLLDTEKQSDPIISYKNKEEVVKYYKIIVRVAGEERKLIYIPLYSKDKIIKKVLSDKLECIGSSSDNFVVKHKCYFNGSKKTDLFILKMQKIELERYFKVAPKANYNFTFAQKNLIKIPRKMNGVSGGPENFSNNLPNVIKKLKAKNNGVLPGYLIDVIEDPFLQKEGIEMQTFGGEDAFDWATRNSGEMSKYKHKFFQVICQANIFFHQSNYIYFDWKLENMGLFNDSFKLFDFGGGYFATKEGQSDKSICRGGYDITPGYITKKDLNSPHSQKNWAIPIIAANMINYISFMYKMVILRKDLSGYLSISHTEEQLNLLLTQKTITRQDKNILQYTMSILKMSAHERPTPQELYSNIEELFSEEKNGQ